jgi:hypothetical protein
LDVEEEMASLFGRELPREVLAPAFVLLIAQQSLAGFLLLTMAEAGVNPNVPLQQWLDASGGDD